MAGRPYWSGQIRLALVFLPVNIYTATKRSAQTPLHEYERATGERIRHKNVNESGEEVERDEIVKGIEATRGNAVFLEKEELDAVKLPSSDTLELVQFISADALPLRYVERPYYVLPDGNTAEEIYAVMRDALKAAGKVGIGQITLRGREELCAVMPYENGLMIQTLRYDAELQNPEDFYGELKAVKPSADYVKLAKELITRNTTKPDLTSFHDHYHEAMKELIRAKSEHRAPEYHVAKKPTKVVNLLDALKASLETGDSANDNKPEKKAAAKKKPAAAKKAAPKKKAATGRRKAG